LRRLKWQGNKDLAVEEGYKGHLNQWTCPIIPAF
jgi:hypothetical protein